MILSSYENPNTTRNLGNPTVFCIANSLFKGVFFLFCFQITCICFESFILEHATKVTGYDELNSSLQLTKISGGVAFSHLFLILTQ